MSSTNRGYDRHKSDYYITPQGEVELFLNEFLKVEPDGLNGEILDCCAGGDEKNQMSYPNALINIGVDPYKITTVDIRKDSRAMIKENYLTIDCHGDFDMIITNPPFKITLGKDYTRGGKVEKGILEKALNDVNDGGWVIMLLRLNYFGSDSRKPFWDNYMPKYCFVHHKRMGFIPEKPNKTDSVEYAHFVWKKNDYPEFTQLKVI